MNIRTALPERARLRERKPVTSAGERGRAKVSVLVVGSPGLSRVIAHLFASEPDYEVVGSVRGLKSLASQAERLLPKLIIASVKPVGIGVAATVRTIRGASPRSKLILLCPISDLVNPASRLGADACLDSEKLISQLLPTASALSTAFR